MKKALAAILSAAAAWLLLLAMLLTGVFVCTTSTAFYEREYEKYDNAATIGISDEGLMEVTEGLLDYLWGKRDNLDMQMEIRGEVQEVFSQREKDHMVDVRYLIELARVALYISLPLGAALWGLAALMMRKVKGGMKWCGIGYLSGAGALFVGVGVVVLFAMRDFTAVFIKFHEIFFTNDLWLLNYDDMLIMMVPEPFFVDCAVLIAVIFGIGFLATIALAIVMICVRRRKKRKDAMPIQAISDKNGESFYKIEQSETEERPDASEIFARMGLEEEEEDEAAEEAFCVDSVEPMVLPVEEENEEVEAAMPNVITGEVPVDAAGLSDVSVRFEMKLDLKVEKTADGKVLLTMDPNKKPQVQLSSNPGQLTFTIYDEPAALEDKQVQALPESVKAEESRASVQPRAAASGPAPSPEELLRQMDELMKGFPKESGEDDKA